MDGREKTGLQRVAYIHQTRDRQPPLNTAGSWNINAGTGSFKIADPIIKRHANIDIAGQQEKLGGFSPGAGVTPVIPRQFASGRAWAALPACSLFPIHGITLSLIFPLLHSEGVITGIC